MRGRYFVYTVIRHTISSPPRAIRVLKTRSKKQLHILFYHYRAMRYFYIMSYDIRPDRRRADLLLLRQSHIYVYI